MKKIQGEMSKMKEELSKKVDEAISGKNDATGGKNEASKDAASDVKAGEHAHRKGIYSNVNFDYGQLKALVWFWLIDETLSANLVYQSDYEIGSTTPSDEAMAKIMTMVMSW